MPRLCPPSHFATVLYRMHRTDRHETFSLPGFRPIPWWQWRMIIMSVSQRVEEAYACASKLVGYYSSSISRVLSVIQTVTFPCFLSLLSVATFTFFLCSPTCFNACFCRKGACSVAIISSSTTKAPSSVSRM